MTSQSHSEFSVLVHAGPILGEFFSSSSPSLLLLVTYCRSEFWDSQERQDNNEMKINDTSCMWSSFCSSHFIYIIIMPFLPAKFTGRAWTSPQPPTCLLHDTTMSQWTAVTKKLLDDEDNDN